MKKCPTCNRTYADESLTYCLADGSLLSAPYDPEATQRIPTRDTNPPPTEVLPASMAHSQSISKGRNSILPYILIALLALIIGGGAVALFRTGTKDSASNETPAPSPISSQKQESVKKPTPTPTPRFILEDALQKYKYELGWSGGLANSSDAAKISYYPATDISVNGSSVVMKYSWKDGVLRGSVSGNDFNGTWEQTNGSGDIYLHFSDDYSRAQGRWKDRNSGESGTSFLRRVQ